MDTFVVSALAVLGGCVMVPVNPGYTTRGRPVITRQRPRITRHRSIMGRPSGSGSTEEGVATVVATATVEAIAKSKRRIKSVRASRSRMISRIPKR
jgi:hypothetical protein